MFFFQTLYTQQVYSNGYDFYEWTLEPRVDGSVHVRGMITLGRASSSSYIGFPKNWPVRNMVAWEVETGDSIEIVRTDHVSVILYVFKFDDTKEGGFQFIVEFDGIDIVKEKEDEVYYFHWGWSGICECSATVILPDGHELLWTTYTNSEKVSLHKSRVSVVFTKDDPELGIFRFEVTFSKKGIDLINRGENNFVLRQFEEAKLAYQEAITFYSQFSELFDRDTDEFLAELQTRVTECDQGLMQQQEAETFFNEGITYFEQQQYSVAKMKFEEALAVFTELQDTENVQECEEWIISCEKYLEVVGFFRRYITVIGAVVIVSLLGVGVAVYKVKKKQKIPPELERDKKTLDKMLSKGLISQKEYEVAKKELEDQLVKLEEVQNL